MSVAAWNRDKFTKNPILGNQGRPRSSMLVLVDLSTHGKLVGSACYDTQQVCVYLQQFLTLD